MSYTDKWSSVKNSLGTSITLLSTKSDNLIKIAKIKAELHSCESEVNQLYLKIGKIIYHKYKNSKSSNSTIQNYCKSITRLEKKISSLKKEIIAIKTKNS